MIYKTNDSNSTEALRHQKLLKEYDRKLVEYTNEGGFTYQAELFLRRIVTDTKGASYCATRS